MRFTISALCLVVVALCISMITVHTQDIAQLNYDHKQIAELVMRMDAVESQTQNFTAFKSDMRTLSVKLDKFQEVMAQPAGTPSPTCGSLTPATSVPVTAQP